MRTHGGYRRIAGELRGLGVAVSATTVRKLLREAGLGLSEGIETIRTPVRAPKANAVAERFVRTVRSECLDWLLIVNQRHLERVLRVSVHQYNGHRPHRSLNFAPPDPDQPTLRRTGCFLRRLLV